MESPGTITTPLNQKIASVLAALLILLFIYAALSKLLEFGEFRHQLYNQNIPHTWANPLSWGIPAVELLTCGLLLNRLTQWYGLILATFLMFAFTGYIALVLMNAWPRIPCSCGGVLQRLSWTAHFWFNCFFLAAALAGLCLTPDPWQRRC